MASPLFSTYRAGENRITSSTISVFERIDLALVKELLEGATEMGGELSGVTYQNQVSGPGSVPDARISGRFTWWFETKTARHAYEDEGHDRAQLREHSRHLATDPDAWLFVLTPDPQQPDWFNHLDGVDKQVMDRIAWFSFAKLTTVIEQLMSDPTRLLSEQTRFLLSELVSMYAADGLLTYDDTVVVAARNAWDEYLSYSAYVCQPRRSFQSGVSHFGFYHRGHIMDRVAQIRRWLPSVTFSYEEAARLVDKGEGEVAELITTMLDAGERTAGEPYGVMLLTSPDSSDTTTLAAPIVNDTLTAKGKPWAWTLGQRYTRLDLLTSATHTSDL